MKPTVVAALLLCGSVASAEPTLELEPTCVVIDTELDQLAPADREPMRMLLVRVLEREDLLIVDHGCSETFALAHDGREGGRMTVHLRSSHGARRRTIVAADLKAAYVQLARTLLAAPPATEAVGVAAPVIAATPAAAPTVDPTTVDATPTVDKSTTIDEPSFADPLEPFVRTSWVYRLGFARLGGASTSAMSVGRRYALPAIALDLSLQILAGDHRTSVSAGAEVLRISRPAARGSSYVGGGLSVGSTSVPGASMFGATDTAHNGGLQAEATLGYLFDRRANQQWFVEVSATLPFYEVGDAYTPALVGTLGVGL